MNKIFENPLGENFKLERYPQGKTETLQAWDSADILILEELQGRNIKSETILIMNDSFGALTIALEDSKSYSDSFVAHCGIVQNGGDESKLISDLESIKGKYDLVVMKLPKNMSFFEDQLCKISEVLNDGGSIIVGGMVKHMPKTAFDLINKYIGETSTSLAKKKARLIFASFTKERATSPYPIKIKVPEWKNELTNHSNLFSREKLDIGTRFFLENLPQGDFETILDLGCANGIVGLKAHDLNPSSKIIFSDESFMAVKSAKENCDFEESEFKWVNCYEDEERESVDLVLCNPPFHQSTTIGDFIAWQMFTDSLKALKPGGRIRVIGNNHLAYQVKLKKIFGNSEIVTKNKKFMIIDAYKKTR